MKTEIKQPTSYKRREDVPQTNIELVNKEELILFLQKNKNKKVNDILETFI